ncbi:hypothetical protein KIP88_07840 [Bradyrhizobium sp. SRL28]|uniref:hypothetical protein n=1 Tax=Bradyrhizobium sp. SRL28 TaxID=2836178 RepID=UPI001BDF5056|nr:hypothetical protein [Bradyrhizobium sp. SRL28]MBT1510411.1 hypothetical protein [Bradyrhizobium sp. SRL28]
MNSFTDFGYSRKNCIPIHIHPTARLKPMLLTPHFSLEEFTLSSTALALGIANTPKPAHLANLEKLAKPMEDVRALFNVVIEITSDTHLREEPLRPH